MWPKAISFRPALAINKFFGVVHFFYVIRVSPINSWFLFHFVDVSVILQIDHWSHLITINSISIKKVQKTTERWSFLSSIFVWIFLAVLLFPNQVNKSLFNLWRLELRADSKNGSNADTNRKIANYKTSVRLSAISREQ